MAFGNKNPQERQAAPQSSHNIVGAGTSIKGNIKSNGDLRIDGSLEGNISAKGRIVIGNTGLVTGSIDCQKADISGKLEGKITVEEHLILKSTANIQGDIITAKLSIEPGALLNGTCKMGQNNNAGKKEQSNKQKQK